MTDTPMVATQHQSFTALGYHRLAYFFLAPDGEVRWFDCRTIARLGAALTLIPDMSHWRTLYPLSGRPGSVDWASVGADLIRMAKAAGPYEPRDGEGPGRAGRRPYTPTERLEAYRQRQIRRSLRGMVAAAQLAERQAQRETPAG